LEERNTDKFKLAIFDITRNQKLARQLGISSTPSFVVFKKGKQIEQFLGDRVNREIIEDLMSTLAE